MSLATLSFILDEGIFNDFINLLKLPFQEGTTPFTPSPCRNSINLRGGGGVKTAISYNLMLSMFYENWLKQFHIEVFNRHEVK